MSDINDMSELNIQEADRLEITILMDNYTDMLLVESRGVYRRPQISFPQILTAEHGFSCLIKVYAGSEEHAVLLDAAVTPACLFNNANLPALIDEQNGHRLRLPFDGEY